MSPKKSALKTQPKSVRLTPEEAELLRQISEAELISEAALMRKFMLEWLRRYRLDQAITRYQEGELDCPAPPRSLALPSGNSWGSCIGGEWTSTARSCA